MVSTVQVRGQGVCFVWFAKAKTSPWPPAHTNPHACTAATERSVQPQRRPGQEVQGENQHPPPSFVRPLFSPPAPRGQGRYPPPYFTLPAPLGGGGEIRPPLNSPLTWRHRHGRCPTPLNDHQESPARGTPCPQVSSPRNGHAPPEWPRKAPRRAGKSGPGSSGPTDQPGDAVRACRAVIAPKSPDLRCSAQQRSRTLVVGACKGERGGSQNEAASPPAPAASPGAERAGTAARRSPPRGSLPLSLLSSLPLCMAGPLQAAPLRPGYPPPRSRPALPLRTRLRRPLPPQGRQQRGEAAT
ncbi:basic salivary proline-rich protein 2-like [Pezoporus occidentalis]|uniref:basic salivary proline-rich protein 2-like n=1 Tax=Pezoporus occidentalis TaxID=407982 RepID=UPI002F914637